MSFLLNEPIPPDSPLCGKRCVFVSCPVIDDKTAGNYVKFLPIAPPPGGHSFVELLNVTFDSTLYLHGYNACKAMARKVLNRLFLLLIVSISLLILFLKHMSREYLSPNMRMKSQRRKSLTRVRSAAVGSNEKTKEIGTGEHDPKVSMHF